MAEHVRLRLLMLAALITAAASLVGSFGPAVTVRIGADSRTEMVTSRQGEASRPGGAAGNGAAGASRPSAVTPPSAVPVPPVPTEGETGDIDTAPTTPVPPGTSGDLQLGTTVFAMWRDWELLDELLDRAQASGAPWLRVDVGWCSLEEDGEGEISTWYQDRLDAVVSGAERRGLQLLLMVSCTPDWAPKADTESYPEDPAQFERIMAYLSARYAGRVAAWEIWNEPDCKGGCPNGSPADYVPVLQAGYRGVRAGDPEATVVSGGISGNNVDWLRRMYAAGAQGYFDALAVHPYLDPVTAPPSAPSQGRVYRLTTVVDVHELMVQNGDGDKDIWFTEWGWTTADSGERPGVDEATQAAYLQQSVELITAEYPFVSHAFWFCMRDRDDWTPYENEFGLLHVDGSPKPSFAAMQAANRWLAAQG